jgi:hypothetical protein
MNNPEKGIKKAFPNCSFTRLKPGGIKQSPLFWQFHRLEIPVMFVHNMTSPSRPDVPVNKRMQYLATPSPNKKSSKCEARGFVRQGWFLLVIFIDARGK